MINAKPRFGLDVQDGVEVLFDYQTSRYINVGDLVQEDHGVWDTTKVAELIGAGQSIEAAYTPNSAPAIPGASDEVQQAAQDFMNAPLENAPAPDTGDTGKSQIPAAPVNDEAGSAPETPAEAAAADATATEPTPAPENTQPS